MAVDSVTAVGAALADHTRATVLVALMDGRARTAGELARHAHVSPSTLSGHLARLREVGFVEVVRQGRHRYVRLAGPEVGQLLETVGGLRVPDRAGEGPVGRAPQELRFARSCYDHLAGQLAVGVHDWWLRAGHVERGEAGLALTPSGRAILRDLDVSDWPTPADRPELRPCLDWSERRDHLAGPAAAALFGSLLARKWVVRGPRPRSLRLTPSGRSALGDLMGVELADLAG